jgi:hypothetical protein
MPKSLKSFLSKKFRFETYGPYPFERGAGLVTKSELETFCNSLRTIQIGKSNLARAMGVYIFGLSRGRKRIIPWYVGKTDKGFARRFGEHHAGRGENLFRRIDKKLPPGTLQVFLLARITPNGKFMKVKKLSAKAKTRGRIKPKSLKSIDRLEFLLIGRALAKNPNLLNESQTIFHKEFHVPGFVDRENPSTSNAASALRRMLPEAGV